MFKEFDLSYLNFDRRVLSEQSWDTLMQTASSISEISGLSIQHSDKVKSYKSLS